MKALLVVFLGMEFSGLSDGGVGSSVDASRWWFGSSLLVLGDLDLLAEIFVVEVLVIVTEVIIVTLLLSNSLVLWRLWWWSLWLLLWWLWWRLSWLLLWLLLLAASKLASNPVENIIQQEPLSLLFCLAIDQRFMSCVDLDGVCNRKRHD